MTRQLRLLLGAVAVGAASGAASGWFLRALEAVTDWRIAHPSVIWLLPLAGAAMALVYQQVGGRAVHGNRLTMAEISNPAEGVPLRTAPLVLGGTLATHAFGGSAGREGTALQMAAGLTDGVTRRLRWDARDRQRLLVAALAGGFGSVFGVPWAGLVFAMEVSPAPGPVRWRALPACAIAAFIGYRITLLVGAHHHRYPSLAWPTPMVVLRLVPVAIGFGLVAWVFVRLTETIRDTSTRWFPSPVARTSIGGVVVLLLVSVVGTRDYLGLSLPLLEQATIGVQVVALAFLLKLVFTAVTVGTGFHGGEVTPLFVVGATAGSTFAGLLGGPRQAFACVGMVATFGAAANAPITCIVMGVELFGWKALPLLVVACPIARACSSTRHVYEPVAA